MLGLTKTICEKTIQTSVTVTDMMPAESKNSQATRKGQASFKPETVASCLQFLDYFQLQITMKQETQAQEHTQTHKPWQRPRSCHSCLIFLD